MKLTGIRFRLLLLGIVPAFALTSVLAYYFVAYQINELERSIKERGNIAARQLATASIYGVFSGNVQILQDLADTLLLEKDIAVVTITDLQKRILAEAKTPEKLSQKHLLNFNSPIILSPPENSAGDEISIIYPTDNESTEKQIGSIHIKLSMQNTLASQRSVIYNTLLITCIGLLITALLANHLGMVLSLPIIKLTETVNSLSEGNMSERANFKAQGELEDLREGFNVMAIALQQTQQYLEKQVDNATIQLRHTLKTLEDKNLALEKAGELAVAQNEIKSQFLAHISHEIRTPMNGIVGFTDLLSKTQLTTGQHDQIQLIKNSALNLLSIVNEILDFSSLESGNFSLNYKLCNIRSCLENTACLFNSTSNHARIILDIDTEIPHQISNDSVRFQQIVTNLLGNAVKFTHKGHVIIRCCLIKTGPQFSSLLITVSDNGPGISKLNQSRLFSPFLQLSDYAIENESGTGLGLNISKNIVERMAGNIGFKTLETVGSTFWFTLPVHKKNTRKILSNNLHVVLIDPVTISRNAFKKQLSNLGYSVYCFDSLNSYIEKKPLMIDLVFFQALRRIEKPSQLQRTYRSIKATTQVPIVFVHNQPLLPDFDSPISTFQLPCRSEFLSTFIDSTIHNKVSTSLEQSDLNIIPPKRTDLSVLIADDNEINRLLLKSQIEQLCQNITMANDGSKALKHLQSSSYDLILLDLQMPEINGMELIKIIKMPGCKNNNTPVVAITAHAQEEQRRTVTEAGFDDCLIKPILADQITGIISNLTDPPDNNSKEIAKLSKQNYLQNMLEKTQYNKGLARTLFEKLFDELPGQINIIQKALEQNDINLAKEATHKLHGSVSFCGFSAIQEHAAEIENYLSNGETTNINSMFLALEKEVSLFLSQKHSIMINLSKA